MYSQTALAADVTFLYDLWPMSATRLDIQTQDFITIITFVPPEGGLVTLGTSALLEFEGALQSHAQSRVFILTGQGKGFVCGGDIKEMSGKTPEQAREFALLGQRVMRAIELAPQAVICAVNGYALGGGCEVALACDIRIASSAAKFSQPELALGIPPGWAGTQRLPRLIGLSRAKEMILTGRTVKADEALAIGLVHAIVEPERLMDSALREAKRLLASSPSAVALAKKAFLAYERDSFERGSMQEALCFEAAFHHPDQKEGMGAFLDKRKPKFGGLTC